MTLGKFKWYGHLDPQKDDSTIDATDVANGYASLSYEAVEHSVHVCVNGITGIELLDYSFSNVGGVGRVTFLGDWAATGATPVEVGDSIGFAYLRQGV